MDQRKPLAGRTALVTGASRGIGRAIALAIADAGADVALAARDETTLTKVAKEIEARGRRAVAISADVTQADQVAGLAARARTALGPIHVLVNNAGGGASHKLDGHPDELWHRMIALNLTSAYLVSKALVAGMIEARGGRIVNIASTAARTGARYITAYTAAKHGVLGLTRALAAELVGHGITVNAVCPGYADTEMTGATIESIVAKTARSATEARRTLEATSPQQRLIAPEEIAALTVFLASDAAAGINGQAIIVDGGGLMR